MKKKLYATCTRDAGHENKNNILLFYLLKNKKKLNERNKKKKQTRKMKMWSKNIELLNEKTIDRRQRRNENDSNDSFICKRRWNVKRRKNIIKNRNKRK